MAKEREQFRTCEVCGATIYAEHIKKGLADFLAGRLLCPHCLEEKRKIAMVNPAIVFRDEKPAEQEDEPIALIPEEELEDTRGATGPSGTTGGRSGGTSFGMPIIERQYQRPLLAGSRNATRCRTFHCKLNDPSFARLNEVINEWVDANEGIEIKFATSCIGPIESKSSIDQHLILTVFY